MLETEVITGFLVAAVRIATPLLLAAVGEAVSERGGTINLGVEGAMLAGALAAALGAAAGGPEAGLLAAAAAGLLLSAVFAAVTIGAGADQIIAGTAITLGAVGLTGAAFRWAFGTAGAGLTLPLLEPIALPGLSAIPLVGEAFFRQPLPTWLAWLSVPLAWWLLFRTRYGLMLRAAGEDVASARAAGVPVRGVRAAAVCAGGALAGIGGGSLVLAQVGTFAEEMTAGRGFVAIAIVVLGRWHPLGILAAALLFGSLQALQYVFQAMGLDVPYQLFLMLPYALTLLALAGAVGRTKAPGELGR
jgi:simple sugar transport system permease protein